MYSGEKNKKKHAVTFENTLVAVFDIQAYSAFIDRVSKDEAIEKSAKLYSFARSAGTTDFGPTKTRFWILSDTVVMAIDTNRAPLSFASVYVFLHSCSMLLHDSLKFCQLPMRGAIGAGYLYAEDDQEKNDFGDRSFLLGDALVDAARHEKEQNWLGVRFTPRAVKAVEGFTSDDDRKMILDSKKVEPLCAYGEIPMKERPPEKGYYLLPYSKDSNWRSYLPSYFDAEEKLKNTDRLWMS